MPLWAMKRKALPLFQALEGIGQRRGFEEALASLLGFTAEPDDWVFLPETLGLTLLLCVMGMLVVGYAGTEAALRVKPASWLRNE